MDVGESEITHPWRVMSGLPVIQKPRCVLEPGRHGSHRQSEYAAMDFLQFPLEAFVFPQPIPAPGSRSIRKPMSKSCRESFRCFCGCAVRFRTTICDSVQFDAGRL